MAPRLWALLAGFPQDSNSFRTFVTAGSAQQDISYVLVPTGDAPRRTVPGGGEAAAPVWLVRSACRTRWGWRPWIGGPSRGRACSITHGPLTTEETAMRPRPTRAWTTEEG